jgi:6-phosphofructokinase
MAKILGILTGGGDCPGLNAVIRAVVRRADAAGWDVVGVREGWRGLVEPIFEDLGPAQVSGILPRGGTIIGTSRTNPFKLEVVDRVAELPRPWPRRARRDRRRGHARRGGAPVRRASASGGRCPEDHRQRPLRHGLHLRLRHGRLDCDRGDRPAPHDRRVAQPRHGRRGDGPPDGLDRRDERHRRRRRRDPRPRGPGRLRGGRRDDPEAARARQELLDRRRQRGLRAARARGRGRETSSAT